MSPLITQLTYSDSSQSCFWNEIRKKIGRKKQQWAGGVGGRKPDPWMFPTRVYKNDHRHYCLQGDWQQQMDFCSKHFPTGKRGCNVHQATYAPLPQSIDCWTRPARRITYQSGGVKQDGAIRRKRGWRKIKMQMGWLIKWRKYTNRPMLLPKVISSM